MADMTKKHFCEAFYALDDPLRSGSILGSGRDDDQRRSNGEDTIIEMRSNRLHMKVVYICQRFYLFEIVQKEKLGWTNKVPYSRAPTCGVSTSTACLILGPSSGIPVICSWILVIIHWNASMSPR